MPNNRLLAKKRSRPIPACSLDAALEQGGAERVLEVREQLDFVLRTYRGNADLRRRLAIRRTPEQRHVGRQRVRWYRSLWPSALSLSWLSVATSTSFLLP